MRAYGASVAYFSMNGMAILMMWGAEAGNAFEKRDFQITAGLGKDILHTRSVPEDLPNVARTVGSTSMD